MGLRKLFGKAESVRREPVSPQTRAKGRPSGNLHGTEIAVAWKLLLASALALGGCAKTNVPPVDPRPDWHGATIDGLAPLMAPRAVATALRQHGYVRERCLTDEKPIADGLERGDGMLCYSARGGAMRVNLAFLDLNEGRRLVFVSFNGAIGPRMSDAQATAASQAFARRLRARFGRPDFVSKQPAFRTYYWKRPGGSPTLPDMISTTVGSVFGVNATMTSMWAYGQRRPSS